jgi:hypothetical protein
MTARRTYRIAFRLATAACAAGAVLSAGCTSQPARAAEVQEPAQRVTGTNILAASDSLGQQVFVENPAAAALFTPQAIALAVARRDHTEVADVPTDMPRP